MTSEPVGSTATANVKGHIFSVCVGVAVVVETDARGVVVHSVILCVYVKTLHAHAYSCAQRHVHTRSICVCSCVVLNMD